MRFLVSNKKFKNCPESAAAWILGTRAWLPAATFIFYLLRAGLGLHSSFLATPLEFYANGLDYCRPSAPLRSLLVGGGFSLCSLLPGRGCAALRLAARQRAAPEACGTSPRQGAGQGRAAAEAWAGSPGVQAPPPAGLRLGAPPSSPSSRRGRGRGQRRSPGSGRSKGGSGAQAAAGREPAPPKSR